MTVQGMESSVEGGRVGGAEEGGFGVGRDGEWREGGGDGWTNG